ncbi:flavodoxin FldA [Bacteroides mediterraneensis]|uniref:flavodoxin FldA n=1 Tax=Bacteroides mediterraneensis TaxID=1841856 RepID=UPI0026EEF9F8|nr:flavodoxin FldA [Bacteroides mediterraneensis]
MKKTGIFYGSTTGTTESVARLIADKLGIAPADVHEVTQLNTALAESYEALILGTSTWGDGELQDDWYDGLKVLQGAHLSGKIVALFGCGDSESYSDTFCDAMGLLYEGLKDSGCTFVGAVDDSGYTYSASVAATDGLFVGLALDDVNESDRTDDRVSAWAAQLQAELA